MRSCPQCHGGLEDVHEHSRLVWKCHRCHFNLLTFDYFSRHVSEGMAELVDHLADLGRGLPELPCPECHARMLKQHASDAALLARVTPLPPMMQEALTQWHTDEEFMICAHCRYVWISDVIFDRLPKLNAQKVEHDYQQEERELKQDARIIEVYTTTSGEDIRSRLEDSALKVMENPLNLPTVENAPEIRSFSAATWLLVVLCAASTLRGIRSEDFFANAVSFPYSNVIRRGLSLVSGIFLHVNFMHLLSNMIPLVQFGRYVEQEMGWLKYLCFFVIVGFVAGWVQMMVFPEASCGASGAVFAVLAYFCVAFHDARLSYTEIGRSFRVFTVDIHPASYLVFYLILQIWGLRAMNGGEHIGYVAHLVGIALGVLYALVTRPELNEE